MTTKYNSIGPLLIKMESFVMNTNSGRNPAMKSYYAYWESKIYLALTHVLLANLLFLDNLLNGGKNKSKRAVTVKGPLFKIQAMLSAPEIVTSPMANEIYKMTIKYVRSIIDSTKMFLRWQHGTCILTPPQIISEDEEPFIYSFHTDIVANQAIVGAMSQLNTTITKTFTGLAKYLDLWRKYNPLWKVDKVITNLITSSQID